MLRHAALLRFDFSKEHSVTITRVTRIDELGKMLALTINRCTLRRSNIHALPPYRNRSTKWNSRNRHNTAQRRESDTTKGIWNISLTVMINYQNFASLWIYSSPGILKATKQSVSETGSFSIQRWIEEDSYSVGPLERANLSHLFPAGYTSSS
jgi:hypothetical protein